MNMKRQLQVAVVLMGLASVALLTGSGCRLMGANPAPPTAWEKSFFDVSNSVVERVVLKTNFATVWNTNIVVQTNSVTNAVGVMVPQMVLVTNPVPITVPVVAFETQHVEIPQLVPGKGQEAATGIAGLVGGFFGVGGLATTLIGGLFGGWMKMRNRALAGQATTAGVVNGVLTSNIETMLQVLEETPQGKPLRDQVVKWLAQHHDQVGVAEQVASEVAQVDKWEAKEGAQAILGALQRLKPNPTPV